MRGPVVDIAEDVRHRDRLDQLHAGVGFGELLPGVIDLDIGRDVDQPEIGPGRYEDNEAEEAHLTKEERRVHWERLMAELFVEAINSDPLIEPGHYTGILL